MDFLGSQYFFPQSFSISFFYCGFAFQKLLILLRSNENNWITVSQKVASFFCACILSVVHFNSFLLDISGPVGRHAVVVCPVTWVHKIHKLRTPKTQYNHLVFYSSRFGLQLTTMSDNLDFLHFYNMRQKWFQDCHSLFHLWFQVIHSLGHSWVQAGHTQVH